MLSDDRPTDPAWLLILSLIHILKTGCPSWRTRSPGARASIGTMESGRKTGKGRFPIKMCIRDRARGTERRDLLETVQGYVILKAATFETGHGFALGHNPVSYTHLDVYKRQLIGCPINHGIESISSSIS